jgi:phosphoglycerate dehydrogenase-like enzyme
MSDSFVIGISADFKTEAPGLLEPILDEVFGPLPFVETRYFPIRDKVVAPDDIRSFDAVITLKHRFTGDSLAGNAQLVAIARWGAGYDMIDVPACTAADVLLSINPQSVRKPVAEGILTLFLALAKNLLARDQLTRSGRHDLGVENAGLSLSGKVFGSVGLGNIAAEMFRLLQPFDPARLLASDPHVSPAQAAGMGVVLVDLPTLFRESDFVAVNCLLNDETRGLINASLLSLMKPTAYLVNTARGGIVRETDLVATLQQKRIAGAGLDVFEQEPLPLNHPLTHLDNVILTPHRIAWSDALYRGNGMGACQNVLTVLQGQVPQHTVNRDIVSQPRFQGKLASLRQRWAALAG